MQIVTGAAIAPVAGLIGVATERALIRPLGHGGHGIPHLAARWALREAEKANIPFLAALVGALRRCSSLVWLATRRSERLALHPASAPKNGILTISASLNGLTKVMT